MSEIIDNVRELANVGHMGQYRRGPGDIPYITHPEAVVFTLKRWGMSKESVLAAAWAHDLLEDTDIDEEDILEAGGSKGEEILSYVKDLTFEPNKWRSKADWLEHIARDGNAPVLYIKAADRYCNTCDFCRANKWEKSRRYLLEAWPIIETVGNWNRLAKEDFTDLVMKIKEHTNEQ